MSCRSARDVTDNDSTLVKLEDGAKIPIVNAPLGREQTIMIDCMPAVEGEVKGRGARILRGSSCNTVILKMSSVPKKKLTSVRSPVSLLDRTVKYLPEAAIYGSMTYFTESITARCMDSSLYDLVLRNMLGAGSTGDPDMRWKRNLFEQGTDLTADEFYEEQTDELQRRVQEVATDHEDVRQTEQDFVEP